MISELVTNAVQHSVGRQLPPQPDPYPRHFDLAIYLTAKYVRVEVYDEERRLPVEVDPHDYSETGRGIKIIKSCVSRWGTRRFCTGKVIWCDVPLPEPSAIGGAVSKEQILQS
ncbi:two-component sensor histidine kinase [Streptomyces sp. B4I13]|nr:two-component sensor histidine kinase [Streptomyces sp. B4I13]